MCSEDLAEITNTSLLTMEDYDEAFLVKGKEKIETTSTQILFHVSKSRANSHIVSGSSSTTLGEEEEEEDHHRQGHENGSSSKVGSSLGGLLACNEDEDEEESGFKTPSSPDHKIPGVTLCPGAPRKPKFHFSSRKRKASSSSSSTISLSSSPSPSRSPPRSSGVRRSLLLDLSQEVESLFPRPVLNDTHRERKRARSGGGCGGGGGDGDH